MTLPPVGRYRLIRPPAPTGTIAKFGRGWPSTETLSVEVAPTVACIVGRAWM